MRNGVTSFTSTIPPTMISRSVSSLSAGGEKGCRTESLSVSHHVVARITLFLHLVIQRSTSSISSSLHSLHRLRPARCEQWLHVVGRKRFHAV